MRTFIALGTMVLGAVAGVVVVAVVADQPSTKQFDQIKSKLPAGCRFSDLGQYGRINQVVLVECDGRPTKVTTNYTTSGKTHFTYAVVQVE